MPQAISYIRFSSSKQEKGDSLRRQNELISQWLNNHPDITLTNMQFQDLGLSGYHGKHLDHGLGKLLAAVESGKIKSGTHLLVENLDRIGRLEASEMLTLLMSIINTGIIIETLGDMQSYTKESLNGGQLYILAGQIQQAFNHSDKLSKRIKAAWKSKVELAESGIIPKRNTPWYITRNPKTNIKDTLTLEDKTVIQKLFSMCLAGVSYNKICDYLTKKCPDRVKTSNSTSMRKLLTNRTAIGYWNEYKIYPAAVEESLFYSVQKEIERRSKGKSQGSKSGHVLAGLVICGECGSNYAVRSHKNSPTSMQCHKANKKGCSNSKKIPLQVINEFRISTQYKYIEKILQSDIQMGVNSELIAIQGNIVETTKQIDNITDLVASTGSAALANKLVKLEDQLANLKTDELTIQQSANSDISIASIKQSGLDFSKDADVLNGMLRKIGYKIIVTNKKMQVDNHAAEYKRWYMGKYQVLIDGEITEYKTSKDTDFTPIENINKLLTMPSTKTKLKALKKSR